MYENDNLNSFPEDINNTVKNEEEIAQPMQQATIEVTEPVQPAPEPEVQAEPVSTGFVLLETPEQEDQTAAAPVSAESAYHAEQTPTQQVGTAQEQTSYTAPNTQGAFSGSYAQQDAYTQQTYSSAQGGSGTPVYNARDIKPRKKTGWGKRIAVLLLSGILLGGSAAGAYLGVMYLADKYGQSNRASLEDVLEEKEVVEPQINKVEPVSVTSNSVGVAYDVSNVVENVMPAMVSIVNNYTETISSFFGQSYTQEGASSGSGIIIGQNDTELLIATNNHVVSGSDKIQITFIDGSVAEAYIKGTDPQMDLAVVSVVLDSLTSETKGAIAVASLGDSEDLKLGEPVIAIGNALGYGQSVTTGVVSAVDRAITMEDGTTGSFIQTDAAINPGNSGGALLNMNGQVIGINSSKIGGTTIEGMGYAIPISAAEPIISDLSLQTTKIKVGESERGYLGVSVQEVTSSISQMYGMPQGVFIAEVSRGGAAEKAGMQVRDIIVKFDSFQISSYSDLQEAMQYYAAGTTVQVEVMRANGNEYESVTLELTLGEKPVQ